MRHSLITKYSIRTATVQVNYVHKMITCTKPGLENTYVLGGKSFQGFLGFSVQIRPDTNSYPGRTSYTPFSLSHRYLQVITKSQITIKI